MAKALRWTFQNPRCKLNPEVKIGNWNLQLFGNVNVLRNKSLVNFLLNNKNNVQKPDISLTKLINTL